MKCRHMSTVYMYTRTPSAAPVYVHHINLKLINPLMMNTGRVMLFQSPVQQN